MDISKTIDILSRAKASGMNIFLKDDNSLGYTLRNDTIVPPSLIDELRQNKLSLITFLKQEIDSKNLIVAIEDFGQRDPLLLKIPLSFAQERIWVIDQLQGSVNYHVPTVLKLNGNVDGETVEQCLKQIVDRHEILRTIYNEENGLPFQRVIDKNDWTLTRLNTESQQLDDVINEVINKPFLLTSDYSLRACLISLGAEHFLVIVVHHIATDGWSQGIFVDEVIELYHAITEKRDHSLPTPSQYGDFAIWQRKTFTDDFLELSLTRWKRMLSGLGALVLPYDFKRPLVQAGRGRAFTIRVQKALTKRLNELSSQHGSTLFMTLLTGFKVLLYRYSGQADVCVGTPVAGRTHKELENTIGLFVNTLPIRTDLSGNPSILNVLEQVKKVSIDSFELQDTPFEKIVEALELERDLSRTPLVQVMFALQNNQQLRKFSSDQMLVSSHDHKQATSKFDLMFNCEEVNDDISIVVEYNTDLFKDETVSEIAQSYLVLLKDIVENPSKNINDLNVFTEAQRQTLIGAFNDTKCDFPLHKTFLNFFHAQVNTTPSAIAVVFEDQTMTYSDLNAKASQLAMVLMDLNVEVEDRVPVLMERSHHLLVSLLAILKVGGVYVPLDPNFPTDRKAHIIKDCAAKVMVMSAKELKKGIWGRDYGNLTHVICVDSLDKDSDFLEEWRRTLGDQAIQYAAQASLKGIQFRDPSPNNLAYIIYTSGSTGEPKGVMIEHKGMLNHLLIKVGDLKMTALERVAQNSSQTFDISIWQFLSPLIVGGTTVIYGDDLIQDVNAFVSSVFSDGISVLEVVPSYLAVIIEDLQRSQKSSQLSTLRYLLATGESLPKILVEKWFELKLNIPLVNAYGPTEASDDITHFFMHDVPAADSVPIGKVLSNLNIFVVNEFLSLCPFGVIGEIVVSGEGIGRGYLNNPELTHSKFIKNRLAPNYPRLYRTGDYGRWTREGVLEYFGRIDEQVKIRGFRIELGEIEAVLNEFEGVLQSVVIASDSNSGSKRLIAYVRASYEMSETNLKTFLKGRLPEFMLPSAIVFLENFPLNSNGKIDKKKLLVPEVHTEESIFAPPRSETEKKLIAIWEGVITGKRIGIFDNFFRIGGDSITTIQIVSRAKSIHLDLTPRDIFQYQTVASLALFLDGKKSRRIQSEQGTLIGDAGLLPIQLEFFEHPYAEIQHYNQSLLLAVPTTVTPDNLQVAIERILHQHDALRFSYVRSNHSWVQQYLSEVKPMDAIMLTGDGDEDQKLIASMSTTLQRSHELAKGVFRAALFVSPDQTQDHRLLIISHHLAIDTISWRILLDQLQYLLTELLSGNTTAALGAKTSSYRDWHRFLLRHAQSHLVEQEHSYWTGISSRYVPLPTDFPVSAARYGEVETCWVSLSREKTQSLLQDVNHRYNLDINDVLLSALARVIHSWSGHGDVVFGLEGHGREDISNELDISNTIGWFTSLYPVCLHVSADMDSGDLLKSVKEQLRVVPGKGLGYGLLRYLHPSTSVRDSLSSNRWDIIFNYLGQLDNVIHGSSLFKVADESIGKTISDDYPLRIKLEITGSIVDGRLNMSWEYASSQYRSSTIESLANQYIKHLEELIDHCRSVSKTEYTPSDYGLSPEIDYKSFYRFLNEDQEGSIVSERLSSVYRLSPMQEGMLFHSLYDQQSKAYVQQFTFDLPEGLDRECFGKSWDYLLSNHSILRTSFLATSLSIPVQCVWDRISLGMEELDFSVMSRGERDKAIEDFLTADRSKGFDLRIAPLMRLTLIRMDENAYKLVWTHHHILLDGWSLPVLMGELLTAYNAYRQQTSPASRKADHYQDYIKYIHGSHKHSSESYWREYMSDFDSPTLLPFITEKSDRNKSDGQWCESFLEFTGQSAAEIKEYARNHRLTVNTMIQGLWSYMLYRYTGQEDVLYGVTVSGRPTDLEDSEHRIGLYINTLPLRVQIDESLYVSSWLSLIQENHSKSREHQYTGLNTIQRWSNINGDLFDSIVVFENYPDEPLEAVLSAGSQLHVSALSVHEQTNYPLTLIVGLSDRVSIKLSYNSSLIDSYYAKKICDHFSTLVNQLIREKDLRVCDLEILSLSEREEILNYHQGATVENLSGRSIIDLLEAQFLLQGEKICLVYEDTRLSYSELNKRCNELGNMLRLGYGVKKGDRIGVLMNRSEWSAICMISIMKLGCVYVPLDPTYPSSRLEYMISNSGVGLLLTHGTVVAGEDELFSGIKRVEVSKELLTGQYSDLNIGESVEGHLCSYVIYTSGSTGLPKGVEQTYEMLYNLITWDVERSGMGHGRRHLQYSSFSFDSSLHDIYYCLITGGEVHILSDACRKDMWSLKDYVIGEGIETLSMPYSALKVLYDVVSEEDLSGHQIKEIISTGEQLYISGGLRDFLQHHPSIRIHNLYGPSETHVITGRHYSFSEGAVPVSATIGKSVDNTHLYIVDKQNRLCPLGCVGELYAGGSNLALGYSANASGTSARFIDNPFRPGEKVYKTGDLCRWLLDGDIEYLGRIDDQVKIRGYRIELGEIETVLQQYGGVSQSVVLAKSDSTGGKRLIGYVVKEGDLDREDLQNHLRKYLPDYMIPSAFVRMDSFPLTSNGKIDKRSLPDSDPELSGSAYVAPRTEVEEKLAKIWSLLLNVDRVSINDNFFRIGGDSIITIQVVSRAKSVGLNFSPRDIFECQTISRLAAFLSRPVDREKIGEQGFLVGSCDLLPIQSHFLSMEYDGISHYNQAVLIEVHKGIPLDMLQKAMSILIQQHDALRFQYIKAEDQWKQQYTSIKPRVNEIKYTTSSGMSLHDWIGETCDRYERSLDISTGQIFNVVLMHTPNTEGYNRLFLVAHHLAVDWVSWRILLDQLQYLLTELLSGNTTAALGAKTSSYRDWHRFLLRHAQSHLVEQEHSYWTGISSRYVPLPTDFPVSAARYGEVETCWVSLSREKTQSLLQDVNHRYNLDINDVLLSALARVIHSWSGHGDVVFGLEGHGREDISNELDISNTIGWFTSLYPVCLHVSADMDSGDLLKSVKEQLRVVPGKGLGYGLLRYLHPSTSVRDSLSSNRWDIIFNYLGQLDNVIHGSSLFKVADESIGKTISDDYPLRIKLEITGSIVDGRLNMSWEYASSQYRSSTIESLANQYIKHLEELIDHCRSVSKTEYTPSDYGLSPEIDYKSFYRFLNEDQEGSIVSERLSSVYRLSPMQEGMLFHSLYDQQSKAYVQQFTFDLPEGLDRECFGKSWDYLLSNHSILRTSFLATSLSIPVQCVWDRISLGMEELDFSVMSRGERDKAIEDFLTADRSKGFDLRIAPLMRLTLIRMDENAYKLVWTHHHILLDGWSLPVLMGELLTAYNAYRQQTSPASRKADHYQDYIKYIHGSHKHSSESYWREYMSDFDSPTLLPFITEKSDRNKSDGQWCESFLEFTGQSAAEIKEYARNHRLTVNTMIQGLWSYMLYRYTGQEDVLYGVTVSGRPTDLEDSEHRIGLYINTLPLRVQIDESLYVSSWLSLIQENHSKSREHQYTGLNTIQRWSNINGDLFDSIVVFENYPDKPVQHVLSGVPALKVENASLKDQTNYPLTLIVGLSDRVSIKLSYNSSLIDSYYAKKICDHFSTLVNQLIREKDLRVCDLEILSLSEREEILNYHQGATVENLSGRSIIDLLEAQFLLQGEKICLVYEDTRLSYSELNKRCNELGNMLRLGYGVKKGDRIGVLMNRSEWSAICMISIMKLGCVYVPLDPTYPSSRLEYMISNSGVGLLLTHGTVVAGEDELFSGIKRVEVSKELLTGQYSDLNIGESVEGHLCSYVIYTSGSTGLPKGVEQTYEMLYNLITWDVERSGMGHGRRHLQYSSFSFDSSLHDIYYCLITGGEVHILSDACRKDMWSLKDYVIGEGIETLSMPYSALKVLYDVVSEEDLSGHQIKEIISTGEQLYISGGLRDFLQHHPSIRIHNLYGPSETHVITGRHYSFSEGAVPVSATIGKSVDNTHLYIVDKQNRLCPLGCVGELYAGGSNLALGYSANASGTSARFIDNPFRPGEKVYKTGDLCRWLLDGDIEYLGRIDDQVKIRGYRIELGEIETVLQQYGGVSQSVVLAKSDSTGGKRLIGYVVKEGDLDREDLQNHLRKYLPDYMIPSAFVRMDSFPLTSNGKIDKRSLPDSDPELSGSAYVAPRTEVEEKLAKIWSSILDLPYESISATSDFFDLGGHSLLSMRLCSWIRKGLSVEISIKDIFGHSKLSALALFIENKERTTYRPLGVIARPSRIPLSYSQERLWFIDRLQGSVNYHVPVILRLMGDLDGMILEKSLQGIVDRHEILRTVYGETDGEAYQEVQSSSAWNLSRKKLRESELLFAIDEIVSAPFDLSKDYMLRGVLVEVDSSSHVLVLVTHHIATDGWSQGIFVDELVSQYEHHQQGKPLRPGLSYQYIDYALWQRDHLSGALLDEKLGYWTSKLSGIQPLDLPTDFSRPAIQSTRGSVYNFTISADLHSGLQSLSQSTGSTLFMTLLSAFKVLLYRYSGQYDISVGSPIAGRTQKELETMIGFFVNTLVLRSNLEGNPRFLDVLHSVKSTTLEAYDHQEVPFEKIVERVEQSRDMSRSPLFQVMFGIYNVPPPTVAHDFNYQQIAYDNKTSEFDLDVTFFLSQGQLTCSFEYCSDLFLESTIAQMCRSLLTILREIVSIPSKRIDELVLLDNFDVEQLLQFSVGSKSSSATAKTILELFEDSVSRGPGTIAVVDATRSMTYNDLNSYANQIAHYMMGHNVRQHDLVAVFLPRSIELIASIIAIMKMGAAYIPVDINYPPNRVKFIVDKTQPKVTITTDRVGAFSVPNVPVLYINRDEQKIACESTIDPQSKATADQLAYVMFTSGTSGTPKGVMIAQRALANLASAMVERYKITSTDKVLQFASISFDMSVEEIFMSIAGGSALVLRPEDTAISFEDFIDHCCKHSVTILNLPPQFLAGLLAADIRIPESVRLVSVGGDVIQKTTATAFLKQYPAVKFFNAYGPTENTVNSAIYEIKQVEDLRTIPIGRPLCNTNAFILDVNKRMVPVGVIGKLFLGGANVAEGYYNEEALTELQFQAVNLLGKSQRLYHSGDLVRWLPSGDIEFFGREDDQLKINGYRIEPSEIVCTLHEISSVSGAAVVVHGDSTDRFLVAYIETTQKSLTTDIIVDHLKSKLPSYFIPRAFVFLEQIPMTDNGKLDRKALPDPVVIRDRVVRRPSNFTEGCLTAIWSEVLGIDQDAISCHDDFFELGGHSLKATAMVSKIQKRIGVRLPLRSIFEHPTIEDISALIMATEASALPHASNADQKNRNRIRI